MSEVLGIVAEYNPFHNGHLYHIQKTKEQTGAKYVVCVMSGNFVQRGNTSIVDKWTKAQIAIENGVDLVLELPTVYSVASAENFAMRCGKNFRQFKNC
ncbi:MAG: nucleotidyltransferase family protein [Clostridiales bacterium]|nr:nucleotidyltransferase family protein [Clostridiales bacterium]